jgi:hypothetical protein
MKNQCHYASNFAVGTELFTACVKQFMQRENDKRNEQAANEPQPGNLNSFNQHNEEKGSEAEGVKKEKDESEGYMDYNGNSEANAPARARE